jgi:hypothetical protein
MAPRTGFGRLGYPCGTVYRQIRRALPGPRVLDMELLGVTMAKIQDAAENLNFAA